MFNEVDAFVAHSGVALVVSISFSLPFERRLAMGMMRGEQSSRRRLMHATSGWKLSSESSSDLSGSMDTVGVLPVVVEQMWISNWRNYCWRRFAIGLI
jgi:hypothetical protein